MLVRLNVLWIPSILRAGTTRHRNIASNEYIWCPMTLPQIDASQESNAIRAQDSLLSE